MNRARILRTLLALVCALELPSIARAQNEPVVKLSDWEQAGNGTGVRFVPLSTLTDTESTQLKLGDQTANGVFQYGTDLSELRWADECRCFRYYVIVVRSTITGQITRHKFKALPSGTFDDQFANVTLTVTQGSKTDTDTLAVPVGSAPGLQPAAIRLSTAKSLESIVLAGETPVRLTIENTGNMDLVISTLSLQPDRTDLWASEPFVQANAAPLQVPAHRSQQLTVHLSPVTKRAISVSWPPTDKTERHTVLNVEAFYENPLFQNRRAEASLVVPIRFEPNLVTLGIALLSGVVLGTLVLLLTKKVTGWQKWLQAAGVALIVGIVFELLGMMLIAGGSKFILFGYSLDPWQTVPVILLGVGVGLLGTKSADQLTKRLKWN